MSAVAVALGVLIGLVVGALLAVAMMARRRHAASVRTAPPDDDWTVPESVVRRLPEVMNLAVVVLDVSSAVALANDAVRRMGVVRGRHLIIEPLHQLARRTRKSGVAQQVVIDLPDSRLGSQPLAVSAQVVPLGHDYIALFLEDITESRRLAAVRRDFVANVSHELKTPVGALTLLAEAVQEACDDPEAVRKFSSRMIAEGERLGSLVRELIELSRLEGADPLPQSSEVSVDELVAAALDATRLAAEAAGITVTSDGQRSLVVRGDEAQLTMALTNLVGNAIAYSPAGTTVTVRARRVPGPGNAGRPLNGRGPSSDPNDDQVEISVIDHGIGIAAADLDRVFERFYRADPARSRATGGTGLGLAIVKHIASNHGGRVQVRSVEGGGSTFTLALPSGEKATAAA
jgi:two-component system sensor histidine kinase SenX3